MTTKYLKTLALIVGMFMIAGTAHANMLGATVNITASNGFGSSCKDASVSGRTVVGGGELVGADWSGGCVGYYGANITGNLLTLVPLESGNYTYSEFRVDFTSGPTITGASFVGYTDNFFQTGDTNNDTNFLPIVSFGPSFVDFRWDTNNLSQFTFNAPINGGSEPFGTAVFSVNTTASSVPEPTSLLLLCTGLGAIGISAWRRKK